MTRSGPEATLIQWQADAPEPKTGYYSLVQYCPDASRLEAVNLGVLLLSPEHRFAKARTVASNDRVRRFFGPDGVVDPARIRAMKAAIEARIVAEAPYLRTVDDLVALSGSLGGAVRLTAPRPVAVRSPDAQLDELLAHLVAGSRQSSSRGRQERRAEEVLRAALERDNLVSRVETNITVRVPALDEELVVPYAYRNGRFNLVRPVGFEVSNPIPKACTYAVEGHSLYKNSHARYGDMQLVLLAAVAPGLDGTVEVIEEIFRENDVKLYTEETVGLLVREVREALLAT